MVGYQGNLQFIPPGDLTHRENQGTTLAIRKYSIDSKSHIIKMACMNSSLDVKDERIHIAASTI